MNAAEIEQYITSNLEYSTCTENFGYKFFLYSTDQMMPFVTLAESDNEYDSVSNLDREGVFRVNIGVRRNTFKKLFPSKDSEWDYTAINTFMPHPEYAAQNFICILSPEDDKIRDVTTFIHEAYSLAKERFEKKQKAV